MVALIAPSANHTNTCNFLTSVKTTAIAYGQNIEAPGNSSPICNSICFYKRLGITSSTSMHCEKGGKGDLRTACQKAHSQPYSSSIITVRKFEGDTMRDSNYSTPIRGWPYLSWKQTAQRARREGRWDESWFSFLWSGFGWVGISVVWRIMQLDLAHRLSQDLARSNRSRFLCSWRILRKRFEGGGKIKLRKIQIKSRGKKEAYGDSMLAAWLPNHQGPKVG